MGGARKVTNAYTITVGKSEGKMPLWRARRRMEDDIIKADLKDVGCELDSTVSKDNPVAGSCQYGNEHYGSIKHGVIKEGLEHKMLDDIKFCSLSPHFTLI
jgi:hypothetical protein